MERYKVKIKGTRPLLVHNPEGAIGDNPKLRRGEHLTPELEAQRSLYLDSDGKPCIPSSLVKACIREAGKGYKVSGRKSSFGGMIRAGLRIEPDNISIIPSNWMIDTRSVVIQRQRILRHRARFNDWSLEFEIINLDPTVILDETLKRIIEDAGKFYGIGDYRPDFGLYTLELFEEVKDAVGEV